MHDRDKMAQSGRHRLRRLRTPLGLAIGGIFLFLSLHRIDFAAVWTALQAVALGWLAPLLVLLLTGFWLRSLRWWRMFPRAASPTLRDAFDAFMIGALGNNLLPGRLGDLLRATLLGRAAPQIGTAGALASIILEKVFDGVVLLAMLAVVLTVAPLPRWLSEAGLWGIAAFGGVLIGLVVLNVAAASSRLMDWAQAHHVIRAALVWFRRLSGGLHGLRTPSLAGRLLLLSLVVWGLETLSLFVTLRMFGLNLPVEAAVVGIVMLSAGTMLPAAPGFVGTYQFFLVTALALYQVPRETALALGLFLNFVVILATTCTGIVAIYLNGGIHKTFLSRRRHG